MKTLDYRPDLDGMRGLGALVIILFHVGFSEPSGGFVTLDMFFVISGFLITRLIRHEFLQSHTFSYSNFYVRRARRLMPALFFTLAVSFAVGVIVFAPHDLARFSGAVVHAVVSLSNFYFWSEAGYFDVESSLKPLLHTWSLGVEEQFYLLWPACLVLLLAKARRLVLPVLFGLGSFSLALNLVFADGEVYFLKQLWPATATWIADGHSTIYFLTPFRVFEFAIGAACVWWLERPALRRVTNETLSVVGLILLVAPMFIYDKDTIFPSIFALPPCLGTAFLISTPSALCNRMLGYRPFVGLGLASYSIYLIHQPIMAFYRYQMGGDLSSVEQWSLSVASVLGGIAMYHWVERPFRSGPRERRWSPAGFGLGCAMFAIILVVASANAWGNRGWTWRYGESQLIKAFTKIDEYRGAREVESSRYLAPLFANTGQKILVVGDSLGGDLVIALGAKLSGDDRVLYHSYRPRCDEILSGRVDGGDAECEYFVDELNRSLKVPFADQIWISFQHSRPYDPTQVTTLVNFLKKSTSGNPRFVLFGSGPDFHGFHSEAISMLAEGESIDDIQKRARTAVDDVTEIDQSLMAAAAAMGMTFVSKFDLFCDADTCKFFTDTNDLMFWDNVHLTVEGAHWYGRQIIANFDHQIVNAAPPNLDPPVQQPQPGTTTPKPSLSGEPVEISITQALKAIEEYGRVLNSIHIDGKMLFDTSILPYSKDYIRSALLLRLKPSPAEQEQFSSRDREVIEYALLTLRFFQSGVGSGTTLDMPGPEQKPWRKHVEAEMIKALESIPPH